MQGLMVHAGSQRAHARHEGPYKAREGLWRVWWGRSGPNRVVHVNPKEALARIGGTHGGSERAVSDLRRIMSGLGGLLTGLIGVELISS